MQLVKEMEGVAKQVHKVSQKKSAKVMEKESKRMQADPVNLS